MQRIERTIIGDTQGRGIVLPLTPHKRVQQAAEILRGKLRQLQRRVLVATFQRVFHHPVA
jgi:hypothetical protein